MSKSEFEGLLLFKNDQYCVPGNSYNLDVFPGILFSPFLDSNLKLFLYIWLSICPFPVSFFTLHRWMICMHRLSWKYHRGYSSHLASASYFTCKDEGAKATPCILPTRIPASSPVRCQGKELLLHKYSLLLMVIFYCSTYSLFYFLRGECILYSFWYSQCLMASCTW